MCHVDARARGVICGAVNASHYTPYFWTILRIRQLRTYLLRFTEQIGRR